jgi:hypothetical protein
MNLRARNLAWEVRTILPTATVGRSERAQLILFA